MASTAATPMTLGVWGGYMPLKYDSLSSVTKLGGTPVFSFPLSLKKQKRFEKARTCKVCGQPMFLILQCYAPLSTGNEDYNRMKYVFACNNSHCSLQASSSWTSLSLTWATYDRNADENDNTGFGSDLPLKEPPSFELLPLYSFPAAYVDIRDEPKKATIQPTREEEFLIAEYERRQLRKQQIEAAKAMGEEIDSEDETDASLNEKEAEILEKEMDLKNKQVDVTFNKFRKRIARCPLQVLRYRFGGPMLFMNPQKVAGVKVPPCPRCGKGQTMELQLMPTLVSLLRTEAYSSNEGLDFATATIFICSDPECGNNAEGLGFAAAFAAGIKKEEGIASGEVACNIREDFLYVEPAPTMEDEKDVRPSLRRIFEGHDGALSSGDRAKDDS